MKSVLKIVILGSCSVGKTSLMLRYCKGGFSQGENKYKPTIGADFLSKQVKVGDQTISAQIWDTAGQERFRGLGSAYFRGADAVILVFDITSEQTFLDLYEWKEAFIEQTNSVNLPPFFVVGNKLDEEKNREISRRRATLWCSENNMASYNETSAKNATNVDTVFEEIIGQATNTTEAIKSEVGAPITNLVVDLNKPSNTSKQAQQDKGCCD